MNKVISTPKYRMIIDKKIVEEWAIMSAFFNEVRIQDSNELLSMIGITKRRYSV